MFGVNSSVKTTLLKLINGDIEPNNGEIKLRPQVKVGYFSQDAYGLGYQKTGFENLQSIDVSDQAIHQQSKNLDLKIDDLKCPLSEFTRGQLAKIGFIKLLLANTNLLILDEPANHLDIPTKEHIEEALANYEGAVIVASHDRYFLDKLRISQTIELKKDH